MGIDILAMSLLVVIFSATSSFAQQSDLSADMFLGPLPGVTYIYVSGEDSFVVEGIEQVDDTTILVKESYPVPQELVDQGFPAHNERVYALSARGGALHSLYRTQDNIELDVAHAQWNQTFDTLIPTTAEASPGVSQKGDRWTTVPARCRIVSRATAMLFGEERTVLTTSCSSLGQADEVEYLKVFASGLGLLRQGFVFDDESLPLFQLTEIR